jgi:mRNA interferase RelE/StbE
VNGERYEVRFQPAARRAIAERLPESVAAAVLEFCDADLALSPRRVGKPLFGPLAGCHGARRGTYRVVYRIDDQARVVEVLDIDHRAAIYHRSLAQPRIQSLLIGARTEELRALTWSHVDLTGRPASPETHALPPSIMVWWSVRAGKIPRPGDHAGPWHFHSDASVRCVTIVSARTSLRPPGRGP